mmetsp:Transcript_1844/g.6078  ORF Transcript_1844/g.6078 Transcript_1844/m.6078 type:complete len:230 (+) Transcript_1844:1037-1726(+)
MPSACASVLPRPGRHSTQTVPGSRSHREVEQEADYGDVVGDALVLQPPLVAFGHERVHRLVEGAPPGAHLVDHDVHGLLVVHELPDPVRGQEHEGQVRAELVEGAVGLGDDAHLRGDAVPEGAGHGDARCVLVLKPDPEDVVQVALRPGGHAPAAGEDARALPGDVRLVVHGQRPGHVSPGAALAGAGLQVGGDRARITNVGGQQALVGEDGGGARGAAQGRVDTVLLQ